jgi:hypothetical protein
MINIDDSCALLLLHLNKCFINRNKLRSILKDNNISYHIPGPKNHMKTKRVMLVEVNKLAVLKLNTLLEK